MAPPAKLLGFLIVFLQAAVAVVVGFVGLKFLGVTTTKVDLLLNALALTFVLELDQILFQAIITKSSQSMVDKLETVTYTSVLPDLYLSKHKLAFPVMMMIVCAASALAARQAQLDEFRELFSVTATLCLLGGPSKSPTQFAPVPGMCESLLAVTCTPPTAPLQNCVITDFEVGWAKNIKVPSTESVWPGDIFSKHSVNSSPWTWTVSDDPRIIQKFGHRWVPLATQVMIRACAAMYHPGPTQNLVVDGDTNEEGLAAPFFCDKASSNFLNTILNNLAYISWRVNTSHLNLLGMDEELGQGLGRCR
eukprot:gnl/MRDRNA2_/MRDRNA2_210252_c0_seq1.p1 gnl/MRDRNA2_/MRDRNA2_210252_c0~~gnl/MRDRNA2_/MRDRNA2_210252_c0_seq1.p1  ORF type:complete len:332 (-),score=43.47 gnl/MRDRNA2_/MRDRNA2_210252_c0_seq1:94-1011(-)